MNNNDIIVTKDALDITATLECGQLFRYDNMGSHYHLRSMDQECNLFYRGNNTVIESNNNAYFYNYFDLNRDYNTIKQALLPLPYMKEAIKYGGGIRIVNQDPYETVISFIISANNNIPRIKKIIETISRGREFPTIEELAAFSEEDFSSFRTGYRANYLYNTAQFIINHKDEFSIWNNMDTEYLINNLLRLKGVGAKVADCIALFGYHRTNVFPVDTWIMQVYRQCFGDINEPKKMRVKLLSTYGDLSGYAQQYLFYSAREGNPLLE